MHHTHLNYDQFHAALITINSILFFDWPFVRSIYTILLPRFIHCIRLFTLILLLCTIIAVLKICKRYARLRMNTKCTFLNLLKQNKLKKKFGWVTCYYALLNSNIKFQPGTIHTCGAHFSIPFVISWWSVQFRHDLSNMNNNFFHSLLDSIDFSCACSPKSWIFSLFSQF